MQDESESDWREGMPFLGGSLWLDFINTTPVVNGRVLDFLEGQAGLERWAAVAGLADREPVSTSDHESVLALRRMLSAAAKLLMAGATLPPPLLAGVNHALATISVAPRLAARGPELALDEEIKIDGPRVAGLVAYDFARFVTDFDPVRLRACANSACTMMFYDRGRNNTRKWCTMSVCGNRSKVAHYRARKAGKT
jgi:predicted RNA-binding Zn ribbon-like protein